MKINILAKEGENKGSLEMPEQFSEKLREDIIKRAVESEQSKRRQKYGAMKEAGKRHSAFLSKRRHDYRATYGIGQSRTPRKIMSRSGTRMNYVGAVAPMTVGGRRAHPPKAEKKWDREINRKEFYLAVRSAMSATLSKETVKKRGHDLPDNYPFVIDDSFCSMNKTKEVVEALKKIGFEKELKRTSTRKIKPGKGKMRGRKYKKKKSILIITEKECKLNKAAKNIPGVDTVSVEKLSVEMMAPGAVPGRVALWTSKAVEKIGKEKLFV